MVAPVVESKVLIEREHTLERRLEVAEEALRNVFICPRHSTIGFGDLAGQGSKRRSGADSFAPSSERKPGRASSVANTRPRWQENEPRNR